MITSAGCNALDYVLNSPERIDCVDLNPHQTALIDLKLAAFGLSTTRTSSPCSEKEESTGTSRIYRRKLRPYC